MTKLFSLKIYLLANFTLCLIFYGCKKETNNTPVEPPQTTTYAVTVTNNLTNNFYNGGITVEIDSKQLPTISPGASYTVTGITEGVHSISADGDGFINISASIPVYNNFHACIEGGQTIQDIPFWVACP